jgi:GT2 family glycosyltransferase
MAAYAIVQTDLMSNDDKFIMVRNIRQMPSNLGLNTGNEELSVITVNYNSWKECCSLIDSFSGHCPVKKMVIVDHSEDATDRNLDAGFPVKVIAQANKGYGAGLNRGLREIGAGDGMALICNPDIRLLTPQALKKAITYMEEHPDVACLVPRSVDRRMRELRSCRSFFTIKTLLASRIKWLHKRPPQFLKDHFYLEKDGLKSYDIDWGVGAALIVRPSLFPNILSFDEQFFLYFEDVDFCARAWKSGYRVVHFPDLLFEHACRRSASSSLYYLMVQLSSLARFVVKYRGLPTRSDLLKQRPAAPKVFRLPGETLEANSHPDRRGPGYQEQGICKDNAQQENVIYLG